MGKKLKKGSAFVALLLVMMLVLCSCGASASPTAMGGNGSMKYAAADTEAVAYDSGWVEAPAVAPMEAAAEEYGYEVKNTSASGSIRGLESSGVKDKNVKLIFRADMSVQTLDYEATENAIYDLVEKFDGYLENVSKYNGGFYSNNNYVSGDFTVRVPAEHYTEFINTIGDSCHIVNLNQNVEDISLQYSDAEGRLETLKVKYDRLLELLSKADNMTDIIELENAIADCEYAIDNYTSTLRRYDSLVGYSTIYLNVEQVSRLDESVVEDPSFFARLGRMLKRGADNFLDSLDRFIMWLSYNLIGIIIFAVVVILIVRFFKKRKMNVRLPKPKKFGRKKNASEESSFQGIPEEVTKENENAE